MTNLNDHPTVIRYRERRASPAAHAAAPALNAAELRAICLECGVDDVGFVALDHPLLDGEKKDILAVFPWTRSLISMVGRINRENLRSPARSIASLELQQVEDRLNHAAHTLATVLERRGIRAACPAVGFPMETSQWLGKMHVVSHKPVAVAAGLGKMGLHRNVIHPVFGSFVLLNTVLVDVEVDGYGRPLDYNPCLDCKLCSAACPTGAIGPDGVFNSVNCLTHTYRDLLGGFTDWVESVADSTSAAHYRAKVSDAETVSRWQSLAYGPCYKSVYCMAVCPAGDDVIPIYLNDKSGFLNEVVRPLQQRTETIYVLPNSDAESHVLQRFPHKKVARVYNGIRPPSVAAFVSLMPRAFQRHKSAGLNATYHFSFSGEEAIEATVTIRDETIDVQRGLVGAPDVWVRADAKAWLRTLHREASIVKEILLRRIRVKGSMELFKRFGSCFA